MAVAIVRWFCALLGGVLLGSGLVLHGQVYIWRCMRAECDATFFLWRAIGNATFVFQGAEHRMALALNEVPEEVLKESDRSAWVLVIVVSLVALTGPSLRQANPTRAKKAKQVKQVARKS
jgi:hypothetical protein